MEKNKDGEVFKQLLGGEIMSTKLTKYLRNTFLDEVNGKAKSNEKITANLKKEELKMKERILQTGTMDEIKHPEIVSKKMALWIKKYSKNLEVVRSSEEVLSNSNKKVFYIDSCTNTLLGNLDTKGKERSKAGLLIYSFVMALNMLLSLLLSSFKVHLNWRQSRESLGSFDKQNTLGKESFYFSKANYSVYGLKSLGNKQQPSIIKISIFLLLKLFFAFQIILEFGSKKETNSKQVGFLFTALLATIFMEISLKSIKMKFDEVLQLNVNYVESRAYIREKQNTVKQLFRENEKENQKELQKLVEELNSMRIAGNVKKNFILNYFTKNIKTLSTEMSDLEELAKKKSKVLTAYRNEDMMTKREGEFEYTSLERQEGRKGAFFTKRYSRS